MNDFRYICVAREVLELNARISSWGESITGLILWAQKWEYCYNSIRARRQQQIYRFMLSYPKCAR